MEELAAQDKSLNTILVSSLNIELVYIVLKAINQFAQDPISHRVSSNLDISGVIAGDLKESLEEPFTEIDLNAHTLEFER